MVWHVESIHTKPHATCKADMVLISASVVLLSFLSLWEWMFYLSVWLLVGLMACGFHLPSQLVNSAAWEPGSPGLLAQGSLRKGSLRMASSREYWDWRSLVGPRVPGKWLQSHCSCPGPSAVTCSPAWGFFFLFLCYLCNASKDDFGNIQTSCDRSSSSV